MGVRYVRQRDRYSCAPVAFANALKWYGYRFSFKDHRKEFLELFDCSRIGTPYPNIGTIFSRYLGVYPPVNFLMTGIDKILGRGDSLIYVYDDHVSFMYGDYHIINGNKGAESSRDYVKKIRRNTWFWDLSKGRKIRVPEFLCR